MLSCAPQYCEAKGHNQEAQPQGKPAQLGHAVVPPTASRQTSELGFSPPAAWPLLSAPIQPVGFGCYWDPFPFSQYVVYQHPLNIGLWAGLGGDSM